MSDFVDDYDKCINRIANRRMPPDLKDRVAALERSLPNVPAVFHHLLAMLPAPGSAFPAQDRVAFIKAAAAVADLVYGYAPISIEVE